MGEKKKSNQQPWKLRVQGTKVQREENSSPFRTAWQRLLVSCGINELLTETQKASYILHGKEEKKIFVTEWSNHLPHMIFTMTGALCGDEQFGVQPDIGTGSQDMLILAVAIRKPLLKTI